jgi:hypothetical protein
MSEELILIGAEFSNVADQMTNLLFRQPCVQKACG